jgi:hypothetical protein
MAYLTNDTVETSIKNHISPYETAIYDSDGMTVNHMLHW